MARVLNVRAFFTGAEETGREAAAGTSTTASTTARAGSALFIPRRFRAAANAKKRLSVRALETCLIAQPIGMTTTAGVRLKMKPVSWSYSFAPQYSTLPSERMAQV